MHHTIKLYISFILLKNPDVNDMDMDGIFEMFEIVLKRVLLVFVNVCFVVYNNHLLFSLCNENFQL